MDAFLSDERTSLLLHKVMSSVYKGLVGGRPDDAVTNVTSPLTTTEKQTLFKLLGRPAPKVQLSKQGWENISMLDVSDWLSGQKNVILSEQLYVMNLLDNTSFINFISPSMYIDSNVVEFVQYSGNYVPMHRVPNGAVPIAVTDNEQLSRATKKNHGLAYMAPMTSLRDPRFAPAILARALKHFQVSMRLVVDLQNIITWLTEGYNKTIREVDGDVSQYISAQRIMFLEQQDFMAAAQGEDNFMALLTSKKNTTPEIDSAIMPQGFSQYLLQADMDRAPNIEAFYRIFQNGKDVDVTIPGPKNVPRMRNGLYRFELPIYQTGPKSQPTNLLENHVTLGQWYSTDVVPRKNVYSKRPNRLALYDFPAAQYVPIDDSLAVRESGLFNPNPNPNVPNSYWSDEVKNYVSRMNQRGVGEPRGHSDADRGEYEAQNLTDMGYIDFSESPDDNNERGPRTQPIFAVWDDTPGQSRYFTPTYNGDAERYHLSNGAVLAHAKTAAELLAKETGVSPTKLLNQFINIVRDMEAQPYNDRWMEALIKHNIKKILTKVVTEDGVSYVVDGELTPEDLAAAKKTERIVQFKTNQYGSLDLPPVTSDMENITPLCFLDANAWDTIAAERSKVNSPYKAIADRVGPIMDANRILMEKSQDIWLDSKIFDPLTRPVNAHQYNMVQCLFDAILPHRLPLFLPVPPPADAPKVSNAGGRPVRVPENEDETDVIMSFDFKSAAALSNPVASVQIRDETGKLIEVPLALLGTDSATLGPIASSVVFNRALTPAARKALVTLGYNDIDTADKGKKYANLVKNLTVLASSDGIKQLFPAGNESNTKWFSWVLSTLVVYFGKPGKIDEISIRTTLEKRNALIAAIKSDAAAFEAVSQAVKAEASDTLVGATESLREMLSSDDAKVSYEAVVSDLSKIYQKMLDAGVTTEAQARQNLADAPDDAKEFWSSIVARLDSAKQRAARIYDLKSVQETSIDVPELLQNDKIVINFTDPKTYARAEWFRTPLSCSPHFINTIPSRMPKALPADPFFDLLVPFKLPVTDALAKHPSMATISDYFDRNKAKHLHTIKNSYFPRAISAIHNSGKMVSTRAGAGSMSRSNDLYDQEDFSYDRRPKNGSKNTGPLFGSTRFYPFEDDEGPAGKAVPEQMFQPDVNKHFRGPWKYRLVELPMSTSDPFLRFAAYCFMFTPMHVNAVSNIMRYGLIPPFDMVYVRPWITYKSLSMILIASGGRAVKTLTDEPYVTINTNNLHREVSFCSYLNFAPMVVNSENIIVLKNVAPSGYVGGLDTRFFKLSRDGNKPIGARNSIVVMVKPLSERLPEAFRWDNSDLATEYSQTYNRSYDAIKPFSMGDFYRRIYNPVITAAQDVESTFMNDFTRAPNAVALTVCRGPHFAIGQENQWVRIDGTGPGGLISQNCSQANAVWNGRKTRFPEENVVVQVKSGLI